MRLQPLCAGTRGPRDRAVKLRCASVSRQSSQGEDDLTALPAGPRVFEAEGGCQIARLEPFPKRATLDRLTQRPRRSLQTFTDLGWFLRREVNSLLLGVRSFLLSFSSQADLLEL